MSRQSDRVVVLRQWTPAFLYFAWQTQKFQRMVKPVLPQPNAKKAKKEILKNRAPLSTTWNEKDVRYSYGMVTVVKKKKVPHLLKQWKRLMASGAVGGLSARRAAALFHVNENQKVVAHVKSLLQDVSQTYRNDFNDLLSDLPLSCGRVSMPAAPVGVGGVKRKAADDESDNSDANSKRLHAAWID